MFWINRPFLLTFFPQIRAFGGEIVPEQKKFPQHFSQKLLIFLTLSRQTAAAPSNPQFAPCLSRLCAASPPAGPGGQRFIAGYR